MTGPQTFNFTKKALEKLVAPVKLTTYHDTQVKGLKCVVRPSGRKTFLLYRKVQGKPERIQIGRFPDCSIEQARQQASGMNTQIAQGENPNDTKRQKQQEMTFKECFLYYVEHHAKIHKKTWKEDLAQLRRHLSHWQERKVSSITRCDVHRLHGAVGREKGIYTANRLLEIISCCYTKANEWGFVEGHPAKGIKKFKEKSRDRFIQSDELPRLFAALSQEINTTARDYILISLLTGARKANVMAMRWNEINFDQALWRIPETKNGDPHTVPLVSAALEILHVRKDNDSPWVFPGRGNESHMTDPKKAWSRVLKAANIHDLRLHDLRRSLGSWQAATGASLAVIGKTLAHKDVGTTAIYARLNLDPVRSAMEKATEAMLNAAQNQCIFATNRYENESVG